MCDPATIRSSRLLIIDDQEVNVRLIERILRQDGYTTIHTTTDPRHVLRLYLDTMPDLIMLDLRMPYLDGFAVTEQLRQCIPEDEFLPIVVLTADMTADSKRRALSLGATDFLTKPFDSVEVLLRIHRLLETRILYRTLQQQNHQLEEKVSARTRALEDARHEILLRLARAAEFRDYETSQHTQRVGQTAALIAKVLGAPPTLVRLMRQAALLHDVGKIGISDTILLKPGKLSVEEFAQMRTHTTIGAEILAGSQFELLNLAQEIALCHHERWDGTGYPRNLRGEAIPLSGRIVAVADTFDALVHKRPYKEAWSIEQAVNEIIAQEGRHFDPEVVTAFLQVHQMVDLRIVDEAHLNIPLLQHALH